MHGINNYQNLLAYYIRLSVEDRNKANKSDESDSIANQRALLQRYVDEHPDLKALHSVEFVDDGESGMNYDRTAFQRLMEEVKKGTVKTIIVKDYSRFGRGYIDASDYLEQIFPFLGVRFISVNDGYDSHRYKYGSAGMIDVGFKQIMHQYYSVTLSQKVLYAHNQLAEKGKFHASYAPYGYVKSSEKYKLEIDEETAEIVRYIFKSAFDGKNNKEIAIVLNEMGAITPLQALRKHNKTVRNWREKASRYIWNSNMITNIIRDERYTGKYIYGKTRVAQIGSKKQIATPKEEWKVIPNVFPVIIPQEMFDAVNSRPDRQKKQTAKPNKESPRLFCNIVCGYCGMSLTFYDVKNPYYICNEYKNGVTTECKCNRAYQSDLVVLTLMAIKEEARKLQEQILVAKKTARKNSRANKIRSLRLKLNSIPAKKEKLFKQLLSGEITKEQNEELYSKLAETEKALNEEITALQSTSEVVNSETETQAFLESLLNRTSLDRKTIQRFVKKIRVYMNERVEITITLKPLNDQEQLVTKTYTIPSIEGNRVWIYFRTWYREEKLKEQRKMLFQYADDNNWDVVGECGDFHSDAKKQFRKVVSAAENGEMDILLVENLNWISQNRTELYQAIENMRKNNVSIVVTTGTPYYTFLDLNLYDEVKGL